MSVVLADCRKCGNSGANCRYHGRGCPKPDCSCAECPSGTHNRKHEEHLHYTCRNCGYDWTSPTIDMPGGGGAK